LTQTSRSRRPKIVSLEALKTTPFDIEECLTLFESQLQEGPSEDRAITLHRAIFALRNLLLMYLGDLSYSGFTPTGRRFGAEVIAAGADVLTFNYDTLAEEVIASASGFSGKVQPARRGLEPVSDEDLDASHHAWKPGLAYGFQFDEVFLPVAGSLGHIEGNRYYAHPQNKLYRQNRVLKLHGSIDWLRYTDSRAYPAFEPEDEPPKKGLVLTRHSNFWMGDSPKIGPWRMEPIIIPPFLYKNFREPPFPAVWSAALETLSECKTLIVVGYSFPPTDFRTRRLFLEAFSDHALTSLVVVNPDTSITGVVRQLCHYSGPVVTCNDLHSFYGEPASWFDFHTVTEDS
jgi:hypothetical protein